MTTTKRKTIDFTDKELTEISLAISCYINHRDTYISKGGAMVLNSIIGKVVDNGLQRRNPEKVIYPLYTFEENVDDA
jgi:hypothetical protein